MAILGILSAAQRQDLERFAKRIKPGRSARLDLEFAQHSATPPSSTCS